jgi:hypothetical protein
VERALFEKVQARQTLGERISNKWLQEQARLLAAQLCPQILADATKVFAALIYNVFIKLAKQVGSLMHNRFIFSQRVACFLNIGYTISKSVTMSP